MSNTSVRAAQRTGARIPVVRGPAARFLGALLRGSAWISLFWATVPATPARAQGYSIQVLDAAGNGGYTPVLNGNGAVLLKRGTGEWQLVAGSQTTSYGFITDFVSLTDAGDALGQNLEIRASNGISTTGVHSVFPNANTAYHDSPFWIHRNDLSQSRRRVVPVKFTTGGAYTVEPAIIEPNLTLTRLGHPPVSGYERLESYPMAINASGEVAGTTLCFLPGASQPSAMRAFLYTGGSMTLLPALAGHANQDWGANDLNDSGQVTGWNGRTGDGFWGVTWTGGVAADITPSPILGIIGTTGIRINNLGQVLLSAPAAMGAYSIFRPGQGYANLVELLPPGHGYDQVDAQDLNHSGQVVAMGRRAGTSIIDTLLLNPGAVPDFELDPTQLAFTQAGVQNVTVRNLGSLALNPVATAATLSGGNWLQVPPASFALGAAAEVALPVTVSFAGLTPGQNYTGTVHVAAAGLTRDLAVTARVPALDSVAWAPGSPQPAPGTPLTFDAAQPSILAPVLVQLGSRATAQLSVEAWDQNGRYLSGTDARRVTSLDGPGLQIFALANLAGSTDLTGVTAVTLRAVLATDDGAAVLATSNAAIYPLPQPLHARWGYFLSPQTHDDFIFEEPSVLHSKLREFSGHAIPGVQIDVPGSAGSRRVEAWVEGFLGTRKTGVLTQRQYTLPEGAGASMAFRLGQLRPEQLQGVDRVEYHVSVRTPGAPPSHAFLSVPVQGLYILSATPSFRQPIPPGGKASLEVVYNISEPGDWNIVLLGASNQVLRTLVAAPVSSGRVYVPQIDPATEMNPYFNSDGWVDLTAQVALRRGTSVVEADFAFFVDKRTPPTRILSPLDTQSDMPNAKAALRNLRTDVARTLEPVTRDQCAFLATGDPAGRPAGVPGGGESLARSWAFGPVIPEDGSFAANLELSYNEEDLPDDPGFSENRLRVIALDPATGAYKPLPTAVNAANKTATAPVTGLASAYALAATGPGVLRFLNLPFLRADGTLSTRLHLCQTGSVAPASVTLSARDPAGDVSVTLALNPNAVSVPPNGSMSLALDAFFGLESSPFGGWVQGTVESAVLGLLEPRSEGRADFLAPPEAATESILPLVLREVNGVDSELHLVNPTRFESVVTLRAIAPDGSVAAVADVRLTPRGRRAGTLVQLLPDVPAGWVGSLRVSCAHPVVACALHLGQRAVSTHRAEPVPGTRAGASLLVAPWFAHGGAHRATLTLVNAGATPANLTIRAVDDNGNTLGAPAARVLAAGAQLRQSAGTLLALGTGAVTGALRVEADHNGVRGHVVVEEEASIPSFATLLPLQAQAWADPVLAALNESTGFATDLSLHNPGLVPQTVWVEARRPDGSRAGRAELTLPAGGRATRRLSTLIPACAGLAAGHLAVHAPDGVFAVATIRELSGNSLATVPAQRALLPAQAAVPELLAWWNFDDASNPAVSLDLVAGRVGTWQQGGHATAAGGGRTGTGADRAADFSLAGSDRLDVLNAGWLDLASAGDAITFAFWQRMTDWSTATSFHAVSPAAELGRGAHAHCPWNNGTIYWDTGGVNSPTAWRTFHAPAPGHNYFLWHHYALVKNGDIKEVWVDGLRIGVGINTADLARDMNKLFIGAHDPATGPDYQMRGYIDDFTVYRSALRAEQIQDLARGTPPARALAGPPGNGRVVATIPPGAGSVTLDWSSLPGEMYAVQVSEDLSLWRTLHTGVRASGANSLAVNLAPQGNPSRLYLRVVPQ